jgi:hypothetical protein
VSRGAGGRGGGALVNSGAAGRLIRRGPDNPRGSGDAGGAEASLIRDGRSLTGKSRYRAHLHGSPGPKNTRAVKLRAGGVGPRVGGPPRVVLGGGWRRGG